MAPACKGSGPRVEAPIAAVAALLAAVSAAAAAGPSLAVLPPVTEGDVPPGVADEAFRFSAGEAFKTGSFTLVPRERTSEALKLLDDAGRGPCRTPICWTEQGRALGADRLLVSRVDVRGDATVVTLGIFDVASASLGETAEVPWDAAKRVKVREEIGDALRRLAGQPPVKRATSREALAPRADGGDAIRIGGDVKPPERVSKVNPLYPEEAREWAAEGRVILEVVVGTGGDVESVEVLHSDPPFDEPAIEAVGHWKYKPALKDGRPVKVFVTVVVDFRLR
jgi:protein TonB